MTKLARDFEFLGSLGTLALHSLSCVLKSQGHLRAAVVTPGHSHGSLTDDITGQAVQNISQEEVQSRAVPFFFSLSPEAELSCLP